MNFLQIPDAIRVPGTYIEIDAREAFGGLSSAPKRVLVFSQMLSTGTAAALEPVMVTSPSQATELFGAGSFADEMAKVLFDNDEFIEKWFVVASDPTGAQANGSVNLTTTNVGDPLSSGSLYLYINGTRIVVPVSVADSSTEVFQNLVAACAEETGLPVSVNLDTVEDEILVFTAKCTGVLGNQIDIRFNWLGEDGNETFPENMGQLPDRVIMSGGTGEVNVTDLLAVVPDEKFDIFLNPYNDTTNLGILEDELEDRWGPMRQIDGMYVTAKKDTLSNLSTFGNARNSPYGICLDAGSNNPTPEYLWASAMAGQMIASIAVDPALPFTSLELKSVIGDKSENRRIKSERNILLYDGIATHRYARDGSVQIERGITLYQTNDAGAPDPAYLDSQTLFTLSELRETLYNRIQTRFSRHKLADRLVAGVANLVTPNIIRAELIDLAVQWEAEGLIENLDQFKADLVVQRNANDRTRVDFKLPPDIVNQFRIFAGSIMFRL